jgi:hypothetical protein
MGEKELLPGQGQAGTHTGINFQRHFTEAGVSPYDSVQWEYRTAEIVNEKGETIFEQKDVEAPKDWSQTATNIVASKYFHGKLAGWQTVSLSGAPTSISSLPTKTVRPSTTS